MHCTMSGSIPSDYPLDISSSPSPLVCRDNRKCLQTWPSVPWEVKLPWVRAAGLHHLLHSLVHPPTH